MDGIGGLLCALRASKYEVFRNGQIKTYPDGSVTVTAFDRCIIRAPGYEEPEPYGLRDVLSEVREKPQNVPDISEGSEVKKEPTDDQRAENLARAKRRARNAVYDIARATDFEYFATFTIDQNKVDDRLDDNEVFKHLHDWLDNNVRRHGLAYVLVPEYHKAGGLHFHAFINDALRVVDSGTISLPGSKKPRKPRSKAQRRDWLDRGGHVVYNLPGWSFGFSTAIRLYGDREAAIGYVTKYISKSEKKIGGRWYYSGGQLRRPICETVNIDFTAASELGEVWTIPELDARGVRIQLKGDDSGETLAGLLRTM